MKFKNYRNSHTNDTRIYSHSDLYNMPLGELFKRKNELLAQYRVLGVPKDSELKNSENVVYVESYTRSDGTEVKAHWRSKPNGGNSSGQAADISNTNSNQETLDNKTTSQDVDNEKLYPKEIAGVKRGKPMSSEEVVRKGVNPNYERDVEEGLNDRNCHSCVIAYEFCRRGYSVNAASTIDNQKAEELANNAMDAWLDPKTGEKCEWDEIDLDSENSFDHLNKTVQQGERYILATYPQMVKGDLSTVSGHAVVVEKSEDGQLQIYDPQRREIYQKNEQVKMYLDSMHDNPNAIKDIYPKYLRIDNKMLNPYYQDVLVR